MNILVTTIINSTKNVEQLLSLFNTSTDIFTSLPDEFYTFKRKYNLTSVLESGEFNHYGSGENSQ